MGVPSPYVLKSPPQMKTSKGKFLLPRLALVLWFIHVIIKKVTKKIPPSRQPNNYGFVSCLVRNGSQEKYFERPVIVFGGRQPFAEIWNKMWVTHAMNWALVIVVRQEQYEMCQL